MGLLDRIKKRKDEDKKFLKDEGVSKELPKGKPLTVKNKNEFIKTCKGLMNDFKGIMFLSGNVDEGKYSASLIVDSGLIIGSTCEFKGLIKFKEQAIDEIKNKLRGSKGILHIFEFDESDLEQVRDSNSSAFLSNPVSLSCLGLKIKFLIEKWAEKQKQGDVSVNSFKLREVFKARDSFNLLELARNPEEVGKPVEGGRKGLGGIEFMDLDFEDLGGMLHGSGKEISDKKSEKLRRIKEERHKKLSEKLAHIKRRKTPKDECGEGKKIQTTIDRLYGMVKKYKKLKIDDRLSHSLGVNKAQIEEWAVILEEHDLIELHYPTIGEPEIRIRDKN